MVFFILLFPARWRLIVWHSWVILAANSNLVHSVTHSHVDFFEWSGIDVCFIIILTIREKHRSNELGLCENKFIRTGDRSQIAAVSRDGDELCFMTRYLSAPLTVRPPSHLHPPRQRRSAAGPAPPPSAWWGCFSDLHFIDASHTHPLVWVRPILVSTHQTLRTSHPPLFLFSFDLLCFSLRVSSLFSSITCVDVFIALIESLTAQPVLKADIDLPGCDFVGRQSTPAQHSACPRLCRVPFYYCVGYAHSQHHLHILIHKLIFSLPYIITMMLTQTPCLRWLRKEAVARGAD